MISSLHSVAQRQLVFVDRNASIGEVMQLMDEKVISHVLIVDGGQLVGLVSKSDLIDKLTKLLVETTGRTMSLIQMRTLKVDQFMQTDLVTVQDSDDVDYAIELLLQKRFHCLPVVNEYNEPVGILTAYDLMKGYYEEDRQ